jgi:hypothetical protein
MSANFYCWAPTADLDPKARDFHEKVEAPSSAPSPRLIAFVGALLARYSDLSQSGDDIIGRPKGYP